MVPPETLIGIAASSAIDDKGTVSKLVADGYIVTCAVKVSYGLGARQGRDQFGFKKTYRPFVRLLAMVKRNDTGLVLWQGAVIAWSENGYKGSKAASKATRDELVSSFEAVSDEAVSLLVNSLNGEAPSEMGVLVDETKEDSAF